MKISKKCQYALKAVFELEKLETGAILGVLLEEGERVRNVPEVLSNRARKLWKLKTTAITFA